MIEKKNIDDLKFVRITDPQVFAIIPRSLFEQIKEINSDTIDMIYKNAADIMMVPILNDKGVIVWNLPKQNVWIAVLHDISHQIKGFLWASFNSIEKCIYIQACALDKEYQLNNGAVTKKGVEYLRSLPIPDDIKANIRMATIKPKAFEKSGWKRSKKILMEFHDVDEKNEQSLPDGDLGGQITPE